jgi:hypothetical protein
MTKEYDLFSCNLTLPVSALMRMRSITPQRDSTCMRKFLFSEIHIWYSSLISLDIIFQVIYIYRNLVNSSNSIIITTIKYGTTRGKLWQMRVFYIAYTNVFAYGVLMNQELLANTAREDSVYVYIFVLISLTSPITWNFYKTFH